MGHLAAPSPFENAFASSYLQNWGIAKDSKKHPEAHDGYTQIIANDRGHLLPSVPRSKTSPWGTFMGTWQMPLQIPPARVTLTSRSTAAANRLINWVQKNPDLLNASNGLRPEIRGHPQEPRPRENDSSLKPPKKTATPKAVQEVPHPAPAEDSPPSRGLPAASPAPPPPQNLIRSCSCSCSCSSSSPSKSAPNSPMTPEACRGPKEPEGQEIQERNMENDGEEPQQETGELAPLSPKKMME
ncbi:protein Flattop isoform X2 [Dromiciops gliroides]|uniref:protein Flattop isoform X2 n=1 Tax=Dromiciops gliroides TaxID=33562 RepID=UPI001CC66D03|nr:protein Flattop isoform X2 [Dromiciops gliroides]